MGDIEHEVDTWVWSYGEVSELDVRHLEWHSPVDAVPSPGTRRGHLGYACRERNEVKGRTLDRGPF